MFYRQGLLSRSCILGIGFVLNLLFIYLVFITTSQLCLRYRAIKYNNGDEDSGVFNFR